MCVTPRDRWRAQLAARRPAASANSDCPFILPAQKRSSALFSSRRGPMRGKPRVLTVMDIHFLSRRRRCSILSSCIDPEKNWQLRRQTASLLLPEDRPSAQIIEDSNQALSGSMSGSAAMGGSVAACVSQSRLRQLGSVRLYGIQTLTWPSRRVSSPSTPLARFCRIVCCAKPWSARDAFIDVLDGYTLSDLVKPRAQLQAMLSTESVKPVRGHAGTRRRGREQGRRVQ